MTLRLIPHRSGDGDRLDSDIFEPGGLALGARHGQVRSRAGWFDMANGWRIGQAYHRHTHAARSLLALWSTE